MRIRLSPCWTDYLRKQPENGMGYQLVDLRFRDGRTLERIPVFNGEYLDLPDEVTNLEIEWLRLAKG